MRSRGEFSSFGSSRGNEALIAFARGLIRASLPRLPQYGLQIVAPLFITEILDQNREDQIKANRGRRHKTKHGQSGIAKHRKICLHLHEQSRSNDERGNNQSSGNSIRHLLKSAQE